MSARPDVVVVGGGIAGLTAALELASSGVRVELVETRKKLGGRATSFDDVRSGERLDNCQHVALGCCTNFIALCERLGVGDLLEFHDRLWWYEPGGRVSEVGAVNWLPTPGHLGPGFVGARFLSTGEKVSLSRAMVAAMRTERGAWRERSFAAWLRARGQVGRVVQRFWQPLIVSACNAEPGDVAASVGLHVVQEGMLSSRRSFEVGVPRVPLVELYDAAGPAIRAAGGRVRLGASAAAVGERFVRLRDGDVIEADRVICATPFERTVGLLEATGLGDERLAMMRKLRHGAIVGVHLRFDRPVLLSPHGVLLGDGTPWVFRKDDEGRAVHVVLSAAGDRAAWSERELIDWAVGVLRSCVPNGFEDGAALEWGRAVKERRATFVPDTMAERNRPAVEGGSGVLLAGCYTATGWPSTMEGATRSGLAAASVAMGEDAGSRIVPSRRVGFVPRILGGSELRALGA